MSDRRFTIEIHDGTWTKDDMADQLEYIAGLIREGMTSGHYPGWTLVENMNARRGADEEER